MCSKRLFRQVLVKSEPRPTSKEQDKEGGASEGEGVQQQAGWQKAAIMLNVMCPRSSGVKTGWMKGNGLG